VLRRVVGGAHWWHRLGELPKGLKVLNHADDFSLTTSGRKFSYLYEVYQHTKLYLSRHPDYGVRLVGT
jgi:hypothetical protein